MKAHLNPAELLQWYVETGADEAIGDAPVDRTQMNPQIPEKSTILSMPNIPLPAVSAPPPPVAGTIAALEEAKALAADATTLEELRTALEKFEGLPLRRTATQMVFADGVPGAKVMVICEAPGTDEDRIGRSFVGETGQLLDKMLAAISLSREENVYITNVINWRPPGNRAPSESEIALSLPFVQRHIELINPSVLIFAGGGASKALLRTTESIMRLRGKWLEYSSPGLPKPIPALAIFHPSYLLQSPGQKKLAWEDLQMLQAKLQELGTYSGI